jgi:clan AA aspartic protease (TIGR02281 family)
LPTTTNECLNPCFWVVRTALAVGLFIVPIASPPTFAGPLEDGRAALFRHRDYATAMRLLRPLAEGGDARAQFYVGWMYEEGWGVRQSSVQAAGWYRKAAEQGEAQAQNSLGLMYFTGDGVPQNYTAAMKWNFMAAKQGNSAAQFAMATFYKHGLGVPQNYILAYMWISVSAHDPDHDEVARGDLAELAPHMAPSQIAEAQSLAQQCIETRYEDCPPAHEKVASIASRNPSQTRVPLKRDGGIFVVPVELNGTMTLDFAIDSGAADVSVPADVVSTLKRTGAVGESDFTGQRTYVLADGSKSRSATFTIRSLRVGDVILQNVRASVGSSQGGLLLGQSFLGRFRSWSSDNAKHELILEPL